MMAAHPSTSTAATSGSAPALRTRYRRRFSFEPLYTGGASTAITADGLFFFAPVNETIHVTSVHSGKTVARIPSDMEEITSLTLTPDQGTLIVASRSLALRIFTLRYPSPMVQESTTSQSNRAVSSADHEQDDKEKMEEVERVTWTLQRTIAKTHDAPVVVMQVDPTSTLVATGSSDTCAKVWDIRAGYCTHVFRGHGGIVSSLAWNMPGPSASQSKSMSNASADRKIELFTASIDGRVRLWDLKAGASGEKAASKPIAILESHFSVVRGLAVSRDGERLVTAGRDRMVGLWVRGKTSSKKDKAKGYVMAWHLVESITAGESLESAGFLEDGDTFWTAGAEGEIRLWSFTQQAVIRLQPGGRFAQGVVNKRNATSGQEEEDDEDENDTRAVTEVHWLSSIGTLATVHADQDIIFRSRTSLERTRQLAGFNDQIIDAALLSPASGADTHLAVATNSTFIRVYNLSAKGHTVDVLPSETDSDGGHTGLILCLDKTTDGKWLASGGKDRTVRLWAWVPHQSAHGGRPIVDDEDEIGMPVDGKDIGNAPQQHCSWSCVAVAEGHTESVGALAFARRPIASGESGASFLVTGSQDRTAKVWDLSTLHKHIAQQFTSEGTRQPLKLTSLTTLKIHDKDINALDVSPNNALLLSGSQDKTAKVFAIQYQAPSKANGHTPAASLRLVKTCQGHKRGVWSVAFSPTDAVFLTASSDRTMKLWSINDGFSCVKNYLGHTNSVLRVRFLKASNGLQCLSCASDGLVKVWNVRTEECLDTLDGHEERVWGLDCTQDGGVIVSGGADGMIRFWHDWTKREEQHELQQRQHDVEQEQAFGNLLAMRDYRNAISLALIMQQPRRLFGLFRTVDQQRDHGDGSSATGAMLHNAIQAGHANGVSTSLRDPALAEVLARAGVMPSSALTPKSSLTANGGKTAKAVDTSITGLAAVDEVIATLSATQLATLLTFVRDWNTTVRTSGVAQTVLHAILRFHSADAIIEAFDKQAEANKGAASDGVQKTLTNRPRRGEMTKATDLANVLDALLPYTRRHYDRAQRVLTESAMLEYTLANMDALLGPDEEAAGDEEQVAKINGGLSSQNGDLEMDESDEDETDESDE